MQLRNRVRIIGGRYRGRRIRVPNVAGLRPTPDRVRETLFNWLGQDLSGASTLDLFAGTGVLTFEAASRGASLCVAVDREPALVHALRKAAGQIGAPGIETHASDASRYLASETRTFDVVFLDPPFADDPWRTLLPVVVLRLSAGGRIYAESARQLEPPGELRVLRYGRAGAVHYHLLARG
ncbi:MAG TPA: 16S rRNA (guanine(966)-N(2))-methyltransferase RsmD [Casimicrobiaceae bacterium]|nr:16S rRNA (guanine(966)-N(2))-methyltransferase RsmD [Casimicrobiaceae bacterium]